MDSWLTFTLWFVFWFALLSAWRYYRVSLRLRREADEERAAANVSQAIARKALDDGLAALAEAKTVLAEANKANENARKVLAKSRELDLRWAALDAGFVVGMERCRSCNGSGNGHSMTLIVNHNEPMRLEQSRCSACLGKGVVRARSH